MKSLVRIVLALLITALVTSGGAALSAAEKGSSLQAAFVRDGDLWVKEDRQERLLAKGPNILNPMWSIDGAYIAYSKGTDALSLWVLDIQSGQSKLVSSEGGSHFQWSPSDNKLAYQTLQQLQYVDAKAPDNPLGSADKIGNFSWLPDGSGFFASSRSELLPDGWTPISLYRIPQQALSDPSQYVTVHVLPRQSDEFFAVGTSIFKWSADMLWIAFFAEPTASLSADSNTLCVVSADGTRFRTLDQIVRNDQWFEWGPEGARLAYISGVGRDAGINKRLKVYDAASGKFTVYTPDEFADQGLAWQSNQAIVVSRAKEMELGASDPTRERLSLVKVELDTGKQTQLTKPVKKRSDYHPIALGPKLAWIRSDDETANVMIGRADGKGAKEWIRGIDQAPNYYGQRDWDAIVRFK